jgi:hypothetical protein
MASKVIANANKSLRISLSTAARPYRYPFVAGFRFLVALPAVRELVTVRQTFVHRSHG